MTGTRGCLTRIALAVGGILFALIAFEIGIRLIENQTGPLFYSGLGNAEYDPRFVQPHPMLDVEHKRNTTFRIVNKEHSLGYFELHTNNLGLRRDEDTTIPKTAGAFRVLVLGDSQTDGLVNNDETWPNVLERLLNERVPRADGLRYEVLNAGVITYQPIQYYLWWKVYGRQLQPDLVLMGYYIGNDLVDAGLGRLVQGPDSSWQLDISPRPPESKSAVRTFLGACRVCVLASYPLRGGPLEEIAARFGLIGSVTEGRYVQAHRLCMGCTWQSLHQARVLEQNPEKYQQDLATTERILKMLKEESEAIGNKFAVVMIPSKLQIDGDADGRAAQVAQLLGLTLHNPPFEDQVERDVAVLGERDQIVTLATQEDLRIFAYSGQMLYYSGDWHLNVAGNMALAQSILKHWSLILGSNASY